MSALIHIRVPATTANMGPGFDCIGMALNLYNHLWVEKLEKDDTMLIIENMNAGNHIPLTDNNLIYRSIKRFYSELGLKDKLPALKLIQYDNIPLTRGLGSSAACVVAGLLAANELSGAGLSREELCRMAAYIEGHPDNSTPALVGGIVIGAMYDGKLDYVKIKPGDGVHFICFIPCFPLPTEKARSVLPKNVPIADAVFNISRAALTVAAFMSGDYKLLGTAMDDKLHQPYRLPLVPGMDEIFAKVKETGAAGFFLSGAGPSIIAVLEGDAVEAAHFIKEMNTYLLTLGEQWTVRELVPDSDGALVSYEEKSCIRY